MKICPFHGPIIPRDDEGTPIYPRDTEKTPAYSLNDETKSVNWSPLVEDTVNLEGKSIQVEELAKQAVKNVRERDKEEANKKEMDKRAVKRAKLAKIREHNDAILRDAAMASTSSSAAFGEPEGVVNGDRASSKNKKPTLASMLRKKVTTKDRLAQRLLGTRARDATIKQLTQGEDTKYRESFPNQW